jgi:hypothetical protein
LDWKGDVQTALGAGFQVVRGSACLLCNPFWIETLVGYTPEPLSYIGRAS